MSHTHSFDIVALAKRIMQRRDEFNRLHPGRRVAISSALSRILQNDPEYAPYRARKAGKKQRPAADLRVSTLVRIATDLETTVGDLLGEPWLLSPADRRRLEGAIRSVLDMIETSRR
jgi:hypothetical protein